MIRARIAGTGHYVPERVVDNHELSRMVDTDDAWIQSRTGIRARRIMAEGEATSDMAAAAGRAALEAAGLSPEELDLIVVATVTPDMPMPSCAVLVQHLLGARCPAFDLSAACAGFSYGLTVIDGLIRGGAFERILFVGAEGLSRFVDWEDRGTCILFGDGAGAVVAVADEQSVPIGDPRARGILATSLDADGSAWDKLNILAGGSRAPASAETVAAHMHNIHMEGRAVFSQAVRHMSDACESVLETVGISAREVDWVIPHQANLRIVEAIAKRLDIAHERVVINLDRLGNTSSASIPIALDEGVRDGRIRQGHFLLMCGLGAGLAWGAALIRW